MNGTDNKLQATVNLLLYRQVPRPLVSMPAWLQYFLADAIADPNIPKDETPYIIAMQRVAHNPFARWVSAFPTPGDGELLYYSNSMIFDTS